MSSTQWFLIHSTIVYSANLYFISETFALPRRGKRDASREKQAIDAKVIDAKEESGGRREKDPNTLFPLVSREGGGGVLAYSLGRSPQISLSPSSYSCFVT